MVALSLLAEPGPGPVGAGPGYGRPDAAGVRCRSCQGTIVPSLRRWVSAPA